METPSSSPPSASDPTRRYVHVRRWRPDGFVEFDFALGDPELCVELILPRTGFDAFCRLPGTRMLSDADAQRVHAREQAYLYGEPWPDAAGSPSP